MTRNRAHLALALIVLATLAAAGCRSSSTPGTPGTQSPAASRAAGLPSTTATTGPHPTDHADHADQTGHDMTQPALTIRRAAATATERAASDDLFARTRASLTRFANEPDAVAAGFVPAPNARGRVIHYRNPASRRDSHALDPDLPEGLVYARNPSGVLVLLGAVFTVVPGETAPSPAGGIFRWHTHDPSCPTFLVPAGGCADTFRMLHIWTTTAVAVTDPWTQPFRAAIGRTSH